MKYLSLAIIVSVIGMDLSQAQDSPHAEWSNLAAGRVVAFVTPPNEPAVTDEEDILQLTDGLFAKANPTMWHSTAAVGWIQLRKVEFTVDLGQVEPIRGVALRVGGGASGVTWPASIQILVSEDGQSFSPVGDVMKLTPEKPQDTGYHEVWLMAEELKTHGRYVKFAVAPGDSGNGVYFFLDEIEIYRGEDSWLSIPLAAPERSAVGLAAPALGRNIAAGARVDFIVPPSDTDVSDGEDERQLVDGTIVTAEPIWTDRKVVGWRGERPVEFMVDLGDVHPINGLAVHLAGGTGGVEWPENLAVEVSENGTDFVGAGNLRELSKSQPPADGYGAIWLLADQLNLSGRYVKFSSLPMDKGNGAYLYLDEIEIYSDGSKAP